VHFVVSERGRVGKCLPNVLFFQIRQLVDNLRRRHAIRDQIQDMCDRDAKAADGRSPSQDVGILRDSIEIVRQELPLGWIVPRVWELGFGPLGFRDFG
jgi:hypothetical protein